MSPSNKDKEIKLVGSELDIFLITGIGTFGWFKGKNIKLNPRPFAEKKQAEATEKNSIDFHVEMAKKIDALIEAHEKEVIFEEVDYTSQEETTLKEIAELRKPVKRKPEMPHTIAEIPSPHVFNNLEAENELFDIDLPGNIHSDFKFVTTLEESEDGIHAKNIEQEPVKDEEFHSWMLGGHKEKQKLAMNFANIKVRKKEDRTKQKAIKSKDKHEKNEPSSTGKKKKTAKINGYTKAKDELEKTKREIDEKKKELEIVEKKEREKEKEVKQKKIERLKREEEQEKHKKLEMEKAQKQAKMKERELKIKTRIMEKKKKEEKKLKALELKKEEKELIKQSRLKEKEKKLEAEKAIKEEGLKRKLLEEKKLKKKEKTKKETKEKLHSIFGKKVAKEAKMKEREPKEKTRIMEKEKKLEAKKALREEKLKQKMLKKKVAKPKKEKIKTKHSTPGMHHFISGKKETVTENPLLNEDIKKILAITDNLLEKLPEEVIDKFAQSEDFELYEKVMSKYKIK